MNTVTYDQRDEGWEPYDEQQDPEQLPRRPRRQFFNKRSAALVAVITCAAGFYAGVRVEKGQLSSSSTGSGLSALAAAAAAARGGAATGASAGGARSGAGGSAAGATGARGATGSGSSSAFPGAAAFGGGGFGGGSASFGTISSVNGRSLFVNTSTGDTVKVKLSSATKITKSLGVKRSSLHPGDTVVIRGLKNSSGTLIATSVSDSGASSSGTGAASSGSGSTGSSSSAVGSLFSGGGSAAGGG